MAGQGAVGKLPDSVPRRERARTASRATPTARLLPSVKEHRTLEELAYRDIRRAIMDRRLAPGQRIVTNAIAAESGVSRIPIIQALRRLQSEGFVRITPHKDVVVRRPSAEEFRERFLLMAVLEAFCLRESVGKITPVVMKQVRALQAELVAARKAKDAARGASLDGEFHMRMYQASGLPRTLQILQNLFDRGEYYRLIMHARRGGSPRNPWRSTKRSCGPWMPGIWRRRPRRSSATACAPCGGWRRRPRR